jgi:hydroxyethylthiazole kinase
VVAQQEFEDTERPDFGPWRTLERVRERRPLVHVITSFVAADLTANLLLAAGARVVMAQDKAEAEDFVALADALCLNLGILTADRVEPMIAVARYAVELGRPWVLDPVGVGASADSAEALDAAHDLSRSTGALVAVSGSVDYVTDAVRLAAVANGHHLMTRVTGVARSPARSIT